MKFKIFIFKLFIKWFLNSRYCKIYNKIESIKYLDNRIVIKYIEFKNQNLTEKSSQIIIRRESFGVVKFIGEILKLEVHIISDIELDNLQNNENLEFELKRYLNL